ncbi:hypothetical protein lerEdw1_020783, partial [Lerista edwardsae]
MGVQVRLPAEALSLPPPPLANKISLWMGFIGWTSALLDNVVNRRPALGAGVHRQLLWATVGFFVGYHLNKRALYNYAKRDRDISEYIRHHPEDFQPKVIEKPRYRHLWIKTKVKHQPRTHSLRAEGPDSLDKKIREWCAVNPRNGEDAPFLKPGGDDFVELEQRLGCFLGKRAILQKVLSDFQ